VIAIMCYAVIDTASVCCAVIDIACYAVLAIVCYAVIAVITKIYEHAVR
jgi:hypothetical protein